MESLTPSELVARRAEVAGKIDALKLTLADIDSRLAEHAKPVMAERLSSANKDSGSLKLSVGGVDLQGEIRKTVKWDSDALKLIAAKLPPADSAVIFTVTLSVSQEQLDTLEEMDHPALGEILCARSVSLSPLSVKPVKAK